MSISGRSQIFQSFQPISFAQSTRRAAAVTVAVVALALPAFASTTDNTAAATVTSSKKQPHHHEADATDFSVVARQQYPFFVSLGAYFPTFTGDGTDNKVGAEVAVGYRFPIEGADFRVSVRGQAFDITDSFGQQSTINVSELSFDAFFRAQQFYFGPGISFGSVTGTTNGFTFDGQDQTVFSLTAGFDFSPRMFAEARWQTADVDAYKGVSINFGYRF